MKFVGWGCDICGWYSRVSDCYEHGVRYKHLDLEGIGQSLPISASGLHSRSVTHREIQDGRSNTRNGSITRS